MKNLTIIYITYRQNPRIEWWYYSLANQIPRGFYPKVVVVDALCGIRELPKPPPRLLEKTSAFVHCKPKPSVWQGEHRLTAIDFHSCSIPRNTGLCHADDGYAAFCDDLSVLLPTWIRPVIEVCASGQNRAVCGSFRKVLNLKVELGRIASFEDDPTGIDYRWRIGKDDRDVLCSPKFLLGCTSVIPVESLLAVNGWPEFLCDSLGFEDCMAGVVLGNNGVSFTYSRRMHEYEAQEHHFDQTVFRRVDPGISPNDKSHKVQEICETLKRFEQDFGGGLSDIADLRRRILRGGEFPIPKGPTTEWYTNMPLSEFHNYEHPKS